MEKRFQNKKFEVHQHHAADGFSTIWSMTIQQLFLFKVIFSTSYYKPVFNYFREEEQLDLNTLLEDLTDDKLNSVLECQ